MILIHIAYIIIIVWYNIKVIVKIDWANKIMNRKEILY